MTPEAVELMMLSLPRHEVERAMHADGIPRSLTQIGIGTDIRLSALVTTCRSAYAEDLRRWWVYYYVCTLLGEQAPREWCDLDAWPADADEDRALTALGKHLTSGTVATQGRAAIDYLHSYSKNPYHNAYAASHAVRMLGHERLEERTADILTAWMEINDESTKEAVRVHAESTAAAHADTATPLRNNQRRTALQRR